MPAILRHRLRVEQVVRESDDACSLIFALTDEQRERFAYQPGQFLTLRVPGDDGYVARCYSLASAPGIDDRLRVTVKRLAEGYASSWICEHATPGTELEALEPSGVFTPRSLDDELLLFAAGSGITPIMSITRSVLLSGNGTVFLFFANRDEKSVIYAEQLRELVREHPKRLTVVHWLESVQGLPTTETMAGIVPAHPERECFVCGPEPFMASVRAMLRELGFPKEKVRIERFGSLAADPFARAVPVEAPTSESAPESAAEPANEPGTADTDQAADLRVDYAGEQHTLRWPSSRRLLDVLRESGLEVPSSCSEGVCAACECRVLDGDVRMVNNQVLEEDDLAEGYVLACQALPESDSVHITYA